MRNSKFPPRTTGFEPLATWQQAVEQEIEGLQPINTPTVRADRRPRGIAYNAAPPGGTGTTVQLCVVTQLFGSDVAGAFDYIGVTLFDADTQTLSGSQFICAKCITARGPISEVIDGQVISYSQYLNDIQRFALNTGSNASEFDSIHPRYIAWPGALPENADVGQYELFVARTVNATGVLDADGNDIFYVEISPCRYWAFNPALNGS